MKKLNVAIVGATGIVGQETIKILEERNFPVAELKLFASSHSAGRKLEFNSREIEVEELSSRSFSGVDLAFFSAGGEISKKYALKAVKAGAVVIDKSSVFRMDNQVPLVVPEVNPRDTFKHNGIIANPNCSTIQLVVALKPIYDLVGIKRLIISTYQSVSGSGKDAVDELYKQTEQFLSKTKISRQIYPHQIAFNVLPHIDVFEDNAFTKEEMKLIHETKKILNDNKIKITATTARIPVFIGHAESVYLETEQHLSISKLKMLYMKTEGIKLVDDLENAKYPLPIMSEVYDDVMIGRIRKDIANENGINLWIVANNIRKGAALNAVQIAEILFS